jgi:epoxyqueuosine reductase
MPDGEGWRLDARLCISYYTIELRGSIPVEARAGIGAHVFGCDICQEVCPWNGRAPVSEEVGYQPRDGLLAPSLLKMVSLSEEEFMQLFKNSPVKRSRYIGYLRNVVIAMGNAGNPEFAPVLERLAGHEDAEVASHAAWALGRIS